MRAFPAAMLFAVLLLASHPGMAQAPAGKPAILIPDCLLTGSQRPDAPVEVTFVTAPDTAVDLSSLHVSVHQIIGWIDVTDRLLKHPRVRVGGWGIHFDGGVLPVGEHQVRLSFHDTKGHVAEAIQTIRIMRANGTT